MRHTAARHENDAKSQSEGKSGNEFTLKEVGNCVTDEKSIKV